MKFRITSFVVALALLVFTLPALAGGYTAEEYKSHIKSALEVEDYAKAVEICNEAIEQYPDDADFWYYKGFALAELEQFDEAMEAYKEADRIKPYEENFCLINNREAQEKYEMGFEQRKSKNYDSAIEYFTEALEIEPENAQTLYETGVCYALIGNYSTSIKYIKEAIRVKPDHAALIALSTVYFMSEDWSNALFFSMLVFEICPSDYEDRGLIEERIEECEKHLNE